MSERKLVDVLNGTRTDIVREVRAADTHLFNLENGLASILEELDGMNKVLRIIKEARGHLAKVSD